MKFIKHTPSDYSPEILKAYPEHAKIKMARRAMEDKDYGSLNKILKVMENPYLMTSEILDLLDIEALKILISIVKSRDDDFVKFTQHVSFNDMDVDDEDDSPGIDFIGQMDSQEEYIKYKEVMKLLLEFQTKDTVGLKALRFISHILTKKEFYSFIEQKGIDLNDEKFSGLDLTAYKFDGLEPLLLQKYSLSDVILNKNVPNLLDLLLSRTYSSELNVDQISKIYCKLYELSPISKEIITYAAALVSKNDDIKIIFGKDFATHYHSFHNLIQIDTNFIKEKIFNIESVLIHELGHYIYEKLFKTSSRPISFDELTKYLKQNEVDIKDPYMEESWPYEVFYNNNRIEKIKEILDNTMQYEKVARKPIEMAAKLLGMDVKKLDKYIDSNDLSEYFKDHSYIDLFNLGRHVDTFDNIYNIYLSEHNFCELENPLLPNLFSNLPIDELGVLTWASEQFLPKMVKEFGYSPTQIHFLERIADYVNRGKHLLSERGREEGDYERHVELAVRASELRAAGVEQDIIDSFWYLEQFHIKTASPKICDFIHTSEVLDLPFDNNALGQNYTCLTLDNDFL